MKATLTEDFAYALVERHHNAIRTYVVRAIARGVPLECLAIFWHHPSHGYYEADRESIEPKRRLELGRDGFVTVMSRMELADHCESIGKKTAAHQLEDITQSSRVVPLVMLCAQLFSGSVINGSFVRRLMVTQRGDGDVEVT